MRTTTYRIKDLIGRVESSPNVRRVTVQYHGFTHTVTYKNDKRSSYVLVVLTGYVLLKRIVSK